MSEMRWLPVVFAVLMAGAYFGMIMKGKLQLLTVAEHRARFFTQLPLRFANVLTYAFGQKKMFKEKGAGIMHAFIFWGFLVLQIRTLYLFAVGFDSSARLPILHHEYMFAKDMTELIVLAMICWAFYRRVITKPARLTLSGEGLLILAMIGGLVLSDFLLDGCAFALGMHASEQALFFDWASLKEQGAAAIEAAVGEEMAAAPVGALFGHMLSGVSVTTLAAFQEIFYWVHIFIVLTLLNLLPGSKHFHVITAIPNVFFGETGPKGAIEPIRDLEHRETFGVGDVKDFTWRQYLDLYTCTECGRCAVNCPTTITGKTLNPKLLIVDIRNHLYAREKELLAGDKDAFGWEVDKHGASLVDDVKYDAIWDCTTCRACSEACPVMIEHVDKVVDLRRHLVLMEANLPKELGQTLRNLESKGNPWGLPNSDRAKWAEGLDVPHLSEAPDAEYVFWVGCAGAYDDRQKKVSRALVGILREAGVSFAFLGEEEGCTGDPARRAGNEYLFQTQAQANIDLLKGYELHRQGRKKRLVTHCPHCFNTIKNEYPQFGGNFEIVHHSTLIEQLIAEGRVKPRRTPQGSRSITYHDSCYLGRYNEVYEQPRKVLQAIPGLEIKEMARSRTTGMCCGAGGARVWMEEHDGDRINHTRVEQALEVQPDTIAVACPFCNLMMEDAIGAKQSSLKSRDIAELVWDSLGKDEPQVAASPAPAEAPSEEAEPTAG